MSLIVFQLGCACGDHISTCGSIVIGAITPSSGAVAESVTSSSDAGMPNVIDGSMRSCAAVGVYPIAGPPARSSSFTPVSTPPATSSPLNRLCATSMR